MTKKRKFKRFFYVFISLLILLLGSTAYIIISSEAPVIYGEVVYQLPYNEDQTVDLYLPTQKLHSSSPTLVFFHGGAWIAGRKESINFNRFNKAINELREKGYAVISPSYTLAEENKSPFPQCIQDAYDLLLWLEENASIYNLDTSNVGLFGESAGAHIALMTSFSSAENFDRKESSIPIRYTIDAYGPTDLESLYQMQHTDSLDLIFSKLPSYLKSYMDISPLIFGFDPQKQQEKAQKFMHRYSPLYYIPESISPLLIIHGDKDQVVPLQQSNLLVEKLDSLGMTYEIQLVENADHAFYGASEKQKDQIQDWIIAFALAHYHD